MTRLQATINLDAIKHNYLQVKKIVNGAKIMAMVKANAYGHGLIEAAKALPLADAFGVAALAEAVLLRQEHITQPVVLMQGVYNQEELDVAKKHNITLVVHNIEQVELLKDNTDEISIWVKVNTGFNRLGFKCSQVPDVIGCLEQSSASIQGIMSHFAMANEQDTISLNKQLNDLNGIASRYNYPLSIANSAGLLQLSSSHLDWVRPGILLYGVSPFTDKTAQDLGLIPAMTLSARITSVYTVDANEKVGYGWHYDVTRPMRIGVVSIGYADGYPLSKDSNLPVKVNGQDTRIIGQVSMDMLAVDLSTINDVKVGDYITLWGDGLSVESVAKANQTSPYALLSSVSSRADRIKRTASVPLPHLDISFEQL